MSSQIQSTRFYKNLRKVNKKDNPSNREMIGLFFDLYELLMAMSEEARASSLSEMFAEGMPKMFQLSPEQFDEAVKRDKKAIAAKKKGSDPGPPGTGQYL